MRFATWLLRPYFDLSPAKTGPLHARNITECWRSFKAPATPRYVPQRAMPPGFRDELLRVLADPRYAMEDPRQLAPDLCTPEWTELCDALEEWPSLSVEQKVRLLVLLHTLGFYDVATALPLGNCTEGWRDDECLAELQFWSASASYMLNLPIPENHFRVPDLSTFDRLAVEAPRGSVVRVDAAIKALVTRAKTRRPVVELEEWASVLEDAFLGAEGRLSGFRLGLLTSRYYRALGFVPQHARDSTEMRRIMDCAESHALALVPSTEGEAVLRAENLHAVLESRTKEALWMGDHDAALSRALRVVEADPCDSKALAELGQVHVLRKEWRLAARAYVSAATMGPPASAIGRHMAGFCFRQLGEDALAAMLFMDAVEIDPGGMSPRDEIAALPGEDRMQLLRKWSSETFPI